MACTTYRTRLDSGSKLVGRDQARRWREDQWSSEGTHTVLRYSTAIRIVLRRLAVSWTAAIVVCRYSKIRRYVPACASMSFRLSRFSVRAAAFEFVGDVSRARNFHPLGALS